MKKKMIALGLTMAMVIVVLCGCNSNSSKKSFMEYGYDEAIAEQFDGCMSIEAILEDTKDIELVHTPDFTGLTPEEVVNEEDDTKDINYKDQNGNIIYTVKEGYGEDSFFWYTKSASGKDLTVNYWSEGEDFRYTAMSCADYSVSYDDFDENSPYRANTICVETKKANDTMLDENLSVEYYDGKWHGSDAFFFDEEGYKHCTFSVEKEGDEEVWTPSTELIHERIETEPECRGDILTDEALQYDPEFIMGDHKLVYLDKPTGQWYITTEFIVPFENELERDDFAKKYQLQGGEPQGNEADLITQRTGKITVPIASDSEDLQKIVNSIELDTWDYYAAKFNEKGEISSIYVSGTFEMY